MATILKKWGYLHNEMHGVTNFYQFSLFMNHEDLSFGGITLKIEFVVFVYELINYEIIFYYLVM